MEPQIARYLEERIEPRGARAPATGWTPGSWRKKPAAQQPPYPVEAELLRVVDEIAQLPPLVTSWEIDALRTRLAEAAHGESFLLQGGDCAESFHECGSGTIVNKLKILLQMSVVLAYGMRRPVIRVGRFAGQYAKPRSEDFETRDGVTLLSYRGDIINQPDFSAAARMPNPSLMLRGYARAAMTLNFIRALVSPGFVDPHSLEYWDLNWVRDSPMAGEYRRIAQAVGESPEMLEHLFGGHPGIANSTNFFTSHEGLLLPYEQAQTRHVPRHTGWYNLSTHYPWIGMRTLAPGAAHVEYFRGIRNPIGLKIGPAVQPETLKQLIGILDPEGEAGRLTLIHRFGSDRIGACLPPLIEAVQSTGRTVLWCCDPMHGNTRNTPDGIKTRAFDDILSELDQAFGIHRQHRSHLGGVHIELTGEDVTECTGGARGLAESDLGRDYRSQLDPRLNYEQSLELALFVARSFNARL